MKKIISLYLLLLLSTYASAQFDHQNINLLSVFDDPNVTPEPTYGIRYQACWGYADLLSGNEYAIIGSTAGTYIIDVTDPINPVQRDYLPGRRDSCIWHEYKTYRNFLYIISDDGGNNSFQIADLSYLPDSIHVIYDGTDIFTHSHTLYIDGDKMYVASVVNGADYSTMNVYSLDNPAYPQLLRRLDQDFPQFSQVHDMYVTNDTVYTSCGWDGLFIFKYDSMQNRFIQLGALTTYPDQGYNHSSFLSMDHSTLYMCDEVPDGMAVKVVDVTTINNPTVADTFYTNRGATPHNPYVKDNHLVLAAYQDGVYIYDISNPQAPVQTGYFDTHPQNPAGTYPSPAYQGCWSTYTDLPSGILLASDMQYGLFCLDISNATGLSENINREFSVYPNPANDHLEINYSGNDLYNLEIINMKGQAVYSERMNTSAVILTNNFTNGLYFLKMITAHGNFTRKFSVIH